MEYSASRAAEPGARIATPMQRISAWVLDAFILGTVFAPLSAIFAFVDPTPTLFLTVWTAGVILSLGYLVAFDGGQRGATPGKRITEIRVVDANTRLPIGYRRATIRTLGYVLGGLLLFVG